MDQHDAALPVPSPTRRACLALPAAWAWSRAEAQGADPVILRTTGQEANTLKFDPGNADAPGLSVEAMRWIERFDPGLRFSGQDTLRPIKRIELEVESGALDVFFGFVRSEAREAKFNVLEALYIQDSRLAVAAADPIEVKSLEEVRRLGEQGRIGVPKGSAYVDFLNAQGGLLVDDGVASVSATLRKLLAGRVRFIFFGGAVLRKYLRDEGLEDRIRILPTRYSVQEVCVMATRQLEAAKLERLRRALEQLRRSGELARLREKYGVAG